LANTMFSSSSEMVRVANQYGVDGDDVCLLYDALSDDDISEIADFVISERGYSEQEILHILKETAYLARCLVHRKLGFILMHDPMFESAEDLLSHLNVAVLRVVREYEIQCATPEHMVARVAKSMKNQAINMAEKALREFENGQTAMEEGELEIARTETLSAVRALDKAVAKGVIHKNNAARRKGRLMKSLAALESEA